MDAEILQKLADIEAVLKSYEWYLKFYDMALGCLCGFLGMLICFFACQYKKLL